MAKKPLRMRLIELRHALTLLKDAHGRVTAGERAYFQVLSVQLRALVGKGGRNHVPLLLDLANILSVPLPVYGAAGPEVDADGIPIRLMRKLVSIGQEFPDQTRVDLRDWLTEKQGPWLLIGGHSYDAVKIIGIMANKYGGAHYDTNLTEGDLWPMLFSSAPNQLLAEELLLQLAAAVVPLGEYVLGVIETGGLAAAGELQRLGYRFDPINVKWSPPVTDNAEISE